jgi:predicted amidohydrolase YtcJ
LQAGYFADLILLDGDPFALPPENLHQYTPAATMVAGEWVWRH